MPSPETAHHAPASTPAPAPAKQTRVMVVYEWQCHICGLKDMPAVTQMQCANCVHVRCPDCFVVATPLAD